MKAHAVLLVPEEGDPRGLLKSSGCMHRPPSAWCYGPWLHEVTTMGSMDINDTTAYCSYCSERWPCSDAGQEDGGRRWVHGGIPGWPDKPGEALVLAWDGEANGHGCFQAHRWQGHDLWVSVHLFLLSSQDAREAAEVYEHLEGAGKLVFVDADGLEVAP